MGWEDPLEKGMVAHSSILAQRILWTEDPGRPGVSPDQGWGLLRGVVSAFTGPVPYTLPALPLGQLSPRGGGGLLLPSPNLPLASACC